MPTQQPRGFRNNNPFNIRKTGINWQGEVPGEDSAFESFESPEMGIRAGLKNMDTHQRKYGITKLGDLIDRHAPPVENDTNSYIDAVSRETGLAPDAEVDLQNPEIATALARAITRHENGQVYGDEVFQGGVARFAGNAQPTTMTDADQDMLPPRGVPAPPPGFARVNSAPAAAPTSSVPPPPAGFAKVTGPPAGFSKVEAPIEPPVEDESLLGDFLKRDARSGQLYIPGPESMQGDFRPEAAVLNGVRNLVTGVVTLPANMAEEYGIDAYKGMGDMIARNIPELRGGAGPHADEYDSGLVKGAEDTMEAVTQYAAPAVQGAKLAGAITQNAPKAVQYLGRMLGAAGGDAVATDPTQAQTLGDIFSFGPTDIQPEDSPMEKRAKVGAETGLVEPVVSAVKGAGRMGRYGWDKLKNFTGYRSGDQVEQAAAKTLQTEVTDRDTAVKNIDKNLEEFKDTGFKPMTGEAAEDVGLIQVQKAQQGQKPLQERKAANEQNVADEFEQFAQRSETGDPNALKNIAEGEYAATVGAKQTAADDLTKQLEAANKELENEGTALAANKDGRISGSEKIDAIVRQTEERMTAAKNELYNEVDPDGALVKPADDFLGAVDAIKPQAGAVDSDIPAPIRAELETLRPQEGVEGGGEVSFQYLVNMRQSVSEAIGAARREGKGAQVKNLVQLKGTIDAEIDSFGEAGASPAADRLRKAQDYYANEFGPRFKQGAGGAFRQETKSGRPNAALPSQTGGKFLDGTKEKAGDLKSIMDAAESPEAGKAAVREYLVGDMASKVTAGGKVNNASLERWIDKNREALKQFPDVQKEIMQMRNQIGTKAKKVGDLQKSVEEAAKDVKLSEKEFNNNALSLYLKNDDPFDAVSKALSGSNRQTKMRQLISAAKKDTSGKALEGLKDTMKEVMRDRLRTSGVTVGGTVKASPAKFIDLAEDKELLKVMDEIFTPEEMKTLRQIRSKLKTINRADAVQGTNKSPTKELIQGQDEVRVVLASMLGITQGKGYFQIGKWLQKALGKDPVAAANQIINDAMLDPELAKTLLMKDISGNEKAIERRLRTYLENNIGALPADEKSNQTPVESGGSGP